MKEKAHKALRVLSEIEPTPDILEEYNEALQSTSTLAAQMDGSTDSQPASSRVPDSFLVAWNDRGGKEVLQPDTRSHQVLYMLAVYGDWVTAPELYQEYDDVFENRAVLSSPLSKLSKYIRAAKMRKDETDGRRHEYKVTDVGIDFLDQHGRPEGEYGVPSSYEY